MKTDEILDALDANHAAMNREESVYSEAASVIRQLEANVGGGDTAIRALEDEAAHLRSELERFRTYLQACREFDAEVDFCDECQPRIECPEHAVQVMSLAKTARQLLPVKPMFDGPEEKA